MAKNEDFERAIGHISIVFAAWDFFVAMIIVAILRPGIDSRDLDDWTLAQKLRYLKGLNPEQVVYRDVLERIQSAIPRAVEVCRQRTRFLRDMWAFRPEELRRDCVEKIALEIEGTPEGRKFSFRTETYSLAQLHELAGKVRRQHDIFLGFLSELPGVDLKAALQSSRRR